MVPSVWNLNLTCCMIQVELVKGHDIVESYQSSGHVQRKFCGRCSSAVFAEVGPTFTYPATTVRMFLSCSSQLKGICQILPLLAAGTSRHVAIACQQHGVLQAYMFVFV